MSPLAQIMEVTRTVAIAISIPCEPNNEAGVFGACAGACARFAPCNSPREDDHQVKATAFFISLGQKHVQKYTIHTETIDSLQRSPFFKDVILSVGGQTFAIWKEGVTVSYFNTTAK